MIARVATFEGIDIDYARSTIDEAEVIRPLVERLAGDQAEPTFDEWV